jgi:hypothetical protein
MARESKDPCEDCPELFEILEENREIAYLFSLSMTQVRRSDRIVWGFDYVAIDLVAKWHGIEVTKELHEGLLICELEYCKIHNERMTPHDDRSSQD